MGEMKDRIARGELYNGTDDDLTAEYRRAQEILERYNASAFAEQDLRDRLLRELLKECGEGVHVRPPFRLEYGTAVSIGAGTFFNYDCLMLDVAPVTVGADCQVASRVQFITATHPIDPHVRRLGWETAEPIVVGDNVWLSSGVILCPGRDDRRRHGRRRGRRGHARPAGGRGRVRRAGAGRARDLRSGPGRRPSAVSDGLAHQLAVVLVDEHLLGLLGRDPAPLVDLVQRLEAVVGEHAHRPPADGLRPALAVDVLL